jgi:hypothetical protein
MIRKIIPKVICKETIQFEVEALENGNLNVYSSSGQLLWWDVSRKGFKQFLSHRVDMIEGGE